MCDSLVMQFPSTFPDSLAKCSQIPGRDCNSEIQLELFDEFLSDNFSMLEVRNCAGEAKSFGSSDKQSSTFPYRFRFQLEQDVQRLRQQLQEEMELHIVLERAVEHTALTTSRLSCLPHNAKELLSSISMLETTVSKLEEEMVSLHYRLSQERNERRLVQYHLKHSPSNSLLGFSKNAEEQLIVTLHENPVVFDKVIEDETTSLQEIEEVVVEKFTREMPVKGLWNHPNQLSEEMVRCMRNIFISLAESSSVQSKPSPLDTQSSYLSPLGHFSNSSLWSLSDQSTVSSCSRSAQSDARRPSQELAKEYACDPYRVRGKLSWANLGRYKSAVEVSWMSVGKAQLEYASEALRKFRSLVEQLAKVNPNHLSGNEKLAFWINLYNALIMHAYLAYGVPKSDLKLFSLMQKAAYTVGGHSFSAAAIEYVILKMKPPVHRPQTSLLLAIHKLKVPEEQGTLSIDTVEPLVAFALSCGMFSSPVVRIYTAKNVRAELQEAQRDFIRAAIGVSSKGKLLVPKMLHCFARGVIDDSSLAVWISGYLPPDQAAFVEQCMSHRRQRFLGSRNCAVLPYDSSFRYLFLPDEVLS